MENAEKLRNLVFSTQKGSYCWLDCLTSTPISLLKKGSDTIKKTGRGTVVHTLIYIGNKMNVCSFPSWFKMHRRWDSLLQSTPVWYNQCRVNKKDSFMSVVCICDVSCVTHMSFVIGHRFNQTQLNPLRTIVMSLSDPQLSLNMSFGSDYCTTLTLKVQEVE